HEEVSAQSTFESGKSVCQGYSDLTLQLAEALGLKAVVLGGYSKGYSYIPGKPSENNHAWNTFRIDGSWYLMDTTWGAGSIGDDRKFRQELSYAWFAMDPQLFLLTHFPEDGSSTLLPAKYTKSDFDRLPYVMSGIFDELYEKGISVSLQRRLASEFGSGLEDKRYSLFELKKVGFGDEEILEVLRKSPEDQSVFEVLELGKLGFSKADLLSYLVNGTSIKVYEIKGDLRVIDVPKIPVLQTGKTYAFKVESKQAYAVAVICGKDWTMLTRDGSIFSGETKVTSGPVKLALRFEEPKSASYSSAISYEVIK
ncbi:MAG: hypothetical protein NT061_11515, partial [Spirochaetes bacterium]|nr:hypothetical protein [Spirochaetota bacterium]